MDGIPIYITGGAGADRDKPIGPYHYLLCTVNEKGAFAMRKVDVPDVANTDYPEYAYWVKYPLEQTLVLSVLLLVAGTLLAWRGFREAGSR